MSNQYVFNRDSIQVNGRTFPARYEVLEWDAERRFNTVYVFATVDGGSGPEEVKIEIPSTDAAHDAAIKAAEAVQDGGQDVPGQDSGNGPEAVQAAADAGQDRGQDVPGMDGGSGPEAVQDGGQDVPGMDGDSGPEAVQDGGQDVPGQDSGNGPEAVPEVTSAPVSAATAEAEAPETVDNIQHETTAAEAVKAAADVETVQAADVETVQAADVETVQAAAPAPVQAATAAATAPHAETINNEEVNTMNKRIEKAAEAVKAAAAAEVEEMTTAAADDPKATRGPVPEKTFKNEVIAGNGWSIVFDAGCNRTRVIIAEPVKAAARPIVEEAGFYYSKNLDSWNKKLTFRAYRAAEKLAEKLRAALA